MARQEYPIDLTGVTAGHARARMQAHQAHPVEVAECLACQHPYLYHFAGVRAGVLGVPAGVGCYECGPGHRCAPDTTLLPVVYYPKHDDAD